MIQRTSEVCPGTRVACPKCGRTLSRVSVRNGDFFAQCGGRSCQAHFYVTCTARLCSVLEVDGEERARFEADQSTSEEILAALGVRLVKAA